MVDFKYLQKGIAGLANAHPLGTMSGHLGAAVAAGYFIGEDHADLSAVVTRGIESELERVLNGEEAIWFDVKKTGIQPTELFEIGPYQAAVPDRIREIAAALAGNVGTLKQSGLNVIFASIAIRALGSHEQYATPWAIDGVCKLIKKFKYGIIDIKILNKMSFQNVHDFENVFSDRFVNVFVGGLWFIVVLIFANLSVFF